MLCLGKPVLVQERVAQRQPRIGKIRLARQHTPQRRHRGRMIAARLQQAGKIIVGGYGIRIECQRGAELPGRLIGQSDRQQCFAEVTEYRDIRACFGNGGEHRHGFRRRTLAQQDHAQKMQRGDIAHVARQRCTASGSGFVGPVRREQLACDDQVSTGCDAGLHRYTRSRRTACTSSAQVPRVG